jgi:subtilisin-like proprotein convertase family protein/subtilisin family serine protease
MSSKFFVILFPIFFLTSCVDKELLGLANCVGTSSGDCKTQAGAASASADPLGQFMWHLNPVTVPYVSGETPTGDHHINLGSLHDTYQGRGVTIVVSDEHMQTDHPDLIRNVDLERSKNYVALVAGVPVTRPSGPYFGNPYHQSLINATHGTNVASVAAAAKDNGTGGFGVAPKAKLVNYNSLHTDARSSILFDQLEIEGGNAIFNYSYGPDNDRFYKGLVGDMDDTYFFVLEKMLSHNSIYKKNIYIQACGNEYLKVKDDNLYIGDSNFTQAASFPYIIQVAATNAQGVRAAYSTPGANVWVAAPGGDVSDESNVGMMVADLVGCDRGSVLDSVIPFDNGESQSLNPHCSYFSSMQGTSFAAPVVTGIVALMKEANPDLNWRAVKHILATTARIVDEDFSQPDHPITPLLNLPGHDYQQEWVENAAGFPFHPWYGFGLVDATAAVNMARTYDMSEVPEGKITSDINGDFIYSSGNINLPIPDYSSVGAESTIDVTNHNLLIEHVLVKVNIEHAFVQDLGIELISPAGTAHRLMNINSGITGSNLEDVYFGANGFFGERTKGEWTIRVVDGFITEAGTLQNWSITFFGNRGDILTDDYAPNPIDEIIFVNHFMSGPLLAWSETTEPDAARYEVCTFKLSSFLELNENLSRVCMDGDWRTVLSDAVLLTSHSQLGGLQVPFESGEVYVGLVRVVDEDENESEISMTSWIHP